LRELSRSLRQALLPRTAPSFAGYDIAAGTALEPDGAGNSLWDWFALPDGSPALYTLNAAATAFPPAHDLALARAFLRELPSDRADLGSLLRRVNTAITRTAAQGIDGTIDCGVLALSAENLSWLGAGTVVGGVIRRSGTMEEFPSSGPPLGLMDGFRYGAADVAMKAGDVAIVLSHGGRGLMRGAADVAAELHGKPAGEVVSKLQSAIQRVAGGNDQGEHSILLVRKR
jgi:sigma-B regulation protein RsbU (phosphoserine phosphatase)